jgi:hypothetical protein
MTNNLTPFETYNTYLALKQHFTSDYDVFKYNWSTRASPASFEKRKDMYFFQKMSKHYDVKNFIVANMIVNPKVWIGELASGEKAKHIYEEWQKRNQSLTYFFKSDLTKLDEDDFNKNFVIEENSEHPKILSLFLGNHITIETFCILMSMTNAISHYDKKLSNDPSWVSISLLVSKYYPFINYDKKTFKKIVLDKYRN